MGTCCSTNDSKDMKYHINSPIKSKQYSADSHKDPLVYKDPLFYPINKTQLGQDFFKILFYKNSQRYTIEEHKVKTDDGFILTMFRINLKDELKKSQETNHKIGHTVVLSCARRISSDVWFLGNDMQSYGGILVNEGYDVWTVNIRGLKYSLDHENPNIGPKDFFNHTFSTYAVYDYPAQLQYIIDFKKMKETGEKMTHFGIFDSNFILPILATFEEMPQYKWIKDHIDKCICNGLIADWKSVKDKAMRHHDVDEKTLKEIKKKSEEWDIYNWSSNWPGSSKNWLRLRDHLIETFGYEDYTDASDIVKHDAESDDFAKICKERFEGGYLNEGQSIMHFHQFVSMKESMNKGLDFQEAYDYGVEQNLKRYGKVIPPMLKYDLYDIPTHIVTFGDNIDTNETQNSIFKERCHPDCKFVEHKMENYTFARMFFGKSRKELRELIDLIMLD